jgi:hypothetical protein
VIRDVLLPAASPRGSTSKFDDRIEPAALLTPPLVAGPEEFDRIAAGV